METDPRFTNYRVWLSSDAQLRQLGYNADTMQQRLGDGYYEQKLVREQIGQLTAQAVVRDLLVVVGQPVFGLFADLAECAEDMHVQDTTPVAAVEAFYEAVLHRTARLDEVQGDALALGPLRQGQRDKFRPVVPVEACSIGQPPLSGSS